MSKQHVRTVILISTFLSAVGYSHVAAAQAEVFKDSQAIIAGRFQRNICDVEGPTMETGICLGFLMGATAALKPYIATRQKETKSDLDCVDLLYEKTDRNTLNTVVRQFFKQAVNFKSKEDTSYSLADISAVELVYNTLMVQCHNLKPVSKKGGLTSPVPER